MIINDNIYIKYANLTRIRQLNGFLFHNGKFYYYKLHFFWVAHTNKEMFLNIQPSFYIRFYFNC